MKRLFCCILAVCMLCLLTACSFSLDDDRDTIQFYYLRANIIYGAGDGVIAQEDRRADDVQAEALLRQYLNGPLSSELVSPFPKGTVLTKLEQKGDCLTVQLSKEFNRILDLDHTLACACLAKTCFSLWDVSEVTILSDDSDRSITLSRDSLTLTDSSDTIYATIGTEAPVP